MNSSSFSVDMSTGLSESHENQRLDPKKEVLDKETKKQLRRLIGEKGSQFTDPEPGMEFKIDISSIIESNSKMEATLEKMMKKKEPQFGSEHLRKAKLSNQFASICMKGEKKEKAATLYLQAIQEFDEFKKEAGDLAEVKLASFSNLWFNQGNQFASVQRYDQAIRAFIIAVQQSPFQILNFLPASKQELSEDELKNLMATEKCHFNSFPAYAHCFTNLSVMMMLKNEYDLANDFCMRAIDLMPTDKEAYINMNNIMRQMGRKEAAFDYVWEKVGQSAKAAGLKFTKPEPVVLTVQQKKVGPTGVQLGKVFFVCVKYGTKYGADYVNKLYASVARNCDRMFSFLCFTEDGEGLDESIEVVNLKETPAQWQGWWSKVHIFNGERYEPFLASYNSLATVCYIDLDMIISGPVDSLLEKFSGHFSTLTTNDIFCEQTQDGYNSSIMIFQVQPNSEGKWKTEVQVLYDTLYVFYEHMTKFLMRFDHYLEMLVHNAVVLQEAVPGVILDYMTHCQVEKLPEGCSIVAFPRMPKPHDIIDKHPWVAEHWSDRKE